MESVLIFLAIIAIQIIAAYSKQKKTVRKKQSVPAEPLPQEAAPIPDPFREIREMMGLPPKEEPEELEEPELDLEPELEQEVEELVLKEIPEQKYAQAEYKPSIDRKMPKILADVRKFNAVKTKEMKNLEQGMLWIAILQQPRFRTKWKPLAFNR